MLPTSASICHESQTPFPSVYAVMDANRVNSAFGLCFLVSLRVCSSPTDLLAKRFWANAGKTEDESITAAITSEIAFLIEITPRYYEYCFELRPNRERPLIYYFPTF